MRDRGAAKGGIVFLLAVVVALLVLGAHWVTYSKTFGGRKICVLTKDKLGLDETVVSASNEAMLLMQHPRIAARLASGSGVCLDL